MPLDQAKIDALYANRRTKGLYEDRIVEAMESDEMGFDVAEDWPRDFAGKNASTLYQGFRNAAAKLNLADEVIVIQRDGSVFLLIASRTNGVNLDTTQNDEDSTTDDVEVPITTSNGSKPSNK